jgi:hypothetical protein
MGMSPLDVRQLLEGYDLEEKRQLILPGTLVLGDATVGMPSAEGVLPFMQVAGAGVPAGAYVVSVDPAGPSVEISAPAVAAGSVSLAFTTFVQLSDSWLANRRDRFVLPWVERKVGFSVSGVQRKTEYHSGTGSSLLILDRRPIVEVHSINLITNPSNWVFVSPTSVEAVSEEGILKLKTVLETWQPFTPAFPRGKDNIKVDYSYGFATCPPDVEEAVNFMVASLALGFLGARTGGGSLSTSGYSRSFGPRGKYTDVRNDLDRSAYVLLKQYFTGMVGG